MRFNRVIGFLFIISVHIFFFMQCEKLPKSPVPDNPLDPNNPKYFRPKVTILSGPEENSILPMDSVTFSWQGDQDSMLFRYKLDDFKWSSYRPDTLVKLYHLDDQLHTFSVQGKVSTGEESFEMTRSFTTDIIKESSLVLYHKNLTIDYFDNFNLELRIDEADSIAAIDTKILFDNSVFFADSVQFFKSDSEAVFLKNGGQLITFSKIDNENGIITLDCAVVEGNSHHIAGSGKIASIFFTHVNGDSSTITISDKSQLRDKFNRTVQFKGIVESKICIY